MTNVELAFRAAQLLRDDAKSRFYTHLRNAEDALDPLPTSNAMELENMAEAAIGTITAARDEFRAVKAYCDANSRPPERP